MNKFSFIRWGIRPFNIALFMAYPVMGAVFAMPDLKWMTLLRLLIFCLLNIPFIAHVYILNDWGDARLNPAEPQLRRKHALKHPEAVSEADVLKIAALLAAFGMTGFLLLSIKIFFSGLIILAITFFYSHPRFTLKRSPPGAILAHFSGACLYFLAGWMLFLPAGTSAFAMAVFFGAVIVAGNFFNEIEDFNTDLDTHLRTAPLALGQTPVFRLALFLFVSSSMYFVILASTGILPHNLVWPGYALLLFWAVAVWKNWRWKGGDEVRSLRLVARMVYAAFCLAVVVILVVEKLKAVA